MCINLQNMKWWSLRDDSAPVFHQIHKYMLGFLSHINQTDLYARWKVSVVAISLFPKFSIFSQV